MRRFMFAMMGAALLVVLPPATDSTLAQSTNGLRIFEAKCASCHQSARDRSAPDASVLRRMSPAAVYSAFAKSPHTQISGLSEDDKNILAAYLGGRKLGVTEIADAAKMPNRCASNSPLGE